MTIRIISKNGEKIYNYPYRVSNLPSLKLFWGFCDGSINATSEEVFLTIKYGESILLKSPNIDILEWKVNIGNDSIIGKGNLLSNEVIKLISMQSSQIVNVKITVKSIDEKNQTQFYTNYFKVDNEYSNSVNAIKCKITIIDKNENNVSLFDSSNPQSFISLLSSNFIQSPSFMSQETIKRIEESKEASSLIEYKSEKYYYPLVETNRNNLNYGKRKVDENGEFVMPEPKVLKYDLSGIDRIIVFEDTVQNPITYEKYVGISHIGLAKKYKGLEKYDIVLIFPFDQFNTMDGYSLRELKTNQLKVNYGLNNENNFIKGIENLILDEVKRLELIDTNSREYRSEILKNSIHFFPSFNELNGFEYQYSPNVTIGKHIVESYFSFEKPDSLLRYFDSVSWIYGDYKLRKMIGGFCYSGDFEIKELGRDKIIYWVLTNNYEISIVRNIRNIEGYKAPCFVPVQLIYSTKIQDKNYPFLAIDLQEVKDSLGELSKVLMMPIPISQLEWKKELIVEMEKSKLKFDLKNKKDIKQLDEIFYLDKVDDKPSNLLGVCVGCN
ncbi:MAG: hypothetical protein HYR91_06505 [Flavobacteriia bacterium]|nr:hypothetical protein [Flavobacteriia bacterium]